LIGFDYNVFKFANFPIDSGIYPVKLFLDRSLLIYLVINIIN